MSLFCRVAKRAVSEIVVLPLRVDRARAHLQRESLRRLAGPRRLAGAVLVVLAVSGLLAWGGYARVGIGLASLAGLLVARRLTHVVTRPMAVAALARKSFASSGVPPARTTLAELGLEADTIERLVSEAGVRGEVVLAEFDQENRIVSHIGFIPFFRDALIAGDQFVPRIRHRLELVVACGVVAVKKAYRDGASFRNEALALAALAAVEGVPKIVALRRRSRTLYQSFIPGQNLGSLMAARGVTVAHQHQVSVDYPGPDNWGEGRAGSARAMAVQVVGEVAGAEVVGDLGRLLERVHQAGVAIRDIKYGNVLLWRGRPYLCDFDLARVYHRPGVRFVEERLADRDQFNFFFGGHLLTPSGFARDSAIVAAATPGGDYAAVYFGWGYQYMGVGNVEFGTGKWRLIRRHLPDLRGKRVLDLGSNNAFLPLEMLRAGARKVTAYEYGPINSQLGRLNHKMFEFVDNRSYDLEIVVAYMHEICGRDWSGYDLVTAYCSLYYEPPHLMERMVQTLSRQVPCMVVQCNENPQEHSGEQLTMASVAYQATLLARNGYPHQRIVRYPCHHRPLIVARAEPVHAGSAEGGERES